MVIYLEVPLASIALIISLMSLKTLKAIKHLDIGKSFWIPVLMSGALFFIGSIMAILEDIGIWSIAYSAEVVAAIQLLALCFLLGGVYTYSRKITKNLIEKVIIQPEAQQVLSEKEREASPSILERINEVALKKETDCKYQLGYLRNFPKNVPIPEECLGCEQIIECKHSLVKKVEGQ